MVVSPGYVSFYDEKFFQAVDITQVLKPMEAIKVKPLDSGTLSDTDSLVSELEYLVKAFDKVA